MGLPPSLTPPVQLWRTSAMTSTAGFRIIPHQAVISGMTEGGTSTPRYVDTSIHEHLLPDPLTPIPPYRSFPVSPRHRVPVSNGFSPLHSARNDENETVLRTALPPKHPCAHAPSPCLSPCRRVAASPCRTVFSRFPALRPTFPLDFGHWTLDCFFPSPPSPYA